MSIYQKILAVMKDVQYLAKDDTVQFNATKYKAITEEKVTTAVRDSMVRNGLVIIPTSVIWSRNGNITHVDTTYDLGRGNRRKGVRGVVWRWIRHAGQGKWKSAYVRV